MAKPAASSTRSPPSPEWAKYPRDKLLSVRLCDLGVAIEGGILERRIAQLHHELSSRGLAFRPHCWLSDEWFTPVGIPGFAIPFFLAHPKLLQLERSMMLDAEGGDKEWCMRILRHETGHAIQYAYRLDRKRRWRELFGKTSATYPNAYHPTPHTRGFVLHIDNWYAQAHPDEDFAETFAVWLTPGSDWRAQYAGWPALEKLEYVDELMREIARTTPLVRSRRQASPINSIRRTLGAHYKALQSKQIAQPPPPHDRDLRRLFGEVPITAGSSTAAAFLRRHRREIVALIARWTGEYQLAIDHAYQHTVARCAELGLRLTPDSDEQALAQEVAVLLTVQTMGRLHSGGHRLTL